MHKVLFVLTIVSSLAHALYNPFFTEDKPPREIRQEKIITETVYQKPVNIVARKSINMKYFGFVSSTIGEFALVNFKGRNIVISANDSLYNNEDIFKISKITSNYILLKDRQGRAQTIYFSSER